MGSRVSLRRYWITFSLPPHELPVGTGFGCGVTAYGRDDALAMVSDLLFDGEEPPIESISEDVDISTLDEGHVRPNMGNPLRRGIWFPIGYDFL